MSTLENILIVDDDAKFREMLTDILTDKGYTVKGVSNGKDAIDETFNQLYNLALIDIQLPDIDGIELLTKLRKSEPEIIKIIITGNATLDNSIDATNKGVDGYLVKPFDPKKLISLVETKLRKQREHVRFDEKKVAEYIESRYEWLANSSLKK